MPWRVARRVQGAHSGSEIGVLGERVQQPRAGYRLHAAVHEREGGRRLDVCPAEVVKVGLVAHVTSVGERRDGVLVGAHDVPAHVVGVQVRDEHRVDFLGGDPLGGQVVHQLAPAPADGLDGPLAVARVDQDGPVRRTHQVTADLDEHVILLERVGIQLLVLLPRILRGVGKQLGERHGKGEVHIGEGDDLNATYFQGEVGHIPSFREKESRWRNCR